MKASAGTKALKMRVHDLFCVHLGVKMWGFYKIHQIKNGFFLDEVAWFVRSSLLCAYLLRLCSSQKGLCEPSHQTICRIRAAPWLVLSEGMTYSELVVYHKLALMIHVRVSHIRFVASQSRFSLSPGCRSTALPSTRSSWRQQRPRSECTTVVKRAFFGSAAEWKDTTALFDLFDPCISNVCSRRNEECICIGCRRKRGEKGEVVETIEDVIVRRLTADRIEELKKLIKETQEAHRFTCTPFNSMHKQIKQLHYKPHEQYLITYCCLCRKLKREAELIQAGHLDSKLEEIWEEILR